jgi:hypothetical protein
VHDQFPKWVSGVTLARYIRKLVYKAVVTRPRCSLDARHDFPVEVLSRAAWLHFCFP